MIVPTCDGVVSDKNGVAQCSTAWIGSVYDEPFFAVAPTLAQYEALFSAFLELGAVCLIFVVLFKFLR